MRVKDHRRAQSGERYGGNYARSVDVDEIGADAGGERADLVRKPGGAAQEASHVGERLVAGRVRAAGDGLGLEPEIAHAVEEFAAAGSPTSVRQPRSRIAGSSSARGLLRAAQIAELVQHQQVHKRTASAKIQK